MPLLCFKKKKPYTLRLKFVFFSGAPDPISGLCLLLHLLILSSSLLLRLYLADIVLATGPLYLLFLLHETAFLLDLHVCAFFLYLIHTLPS